MKSGEAAQDTAGEQEPLAATYLRALLARHGLPKFKQSPWVADALGISYSQAHRKVSGAAPWSLEELAHVASLLGENLSDLIAMGGSGPRVPGTMKIDGVALPCTLALGTLLEDPDPSTIVAVYRCSRWEVTAASRVPQEARYAIEHMDARPRAEARIVIAILDDDRGLTDSVCSYFALGGYDARPFYKIQDLVVAREMTRFDAYVIDWLVQEATSLTLIEHIRRQDLTSPIVVLTGQVLAGVVDESDIAEAVKHHNVLFSEKLVRTSILGATLARALKQSRGGDVLNAGVEPHASSKSRPVGPGAPGAAVDETPL